MLLLPAFLFAQPCPQPTFSGTPIAGGLADGAYAVFAEDLNGDGNVDVLSASFNDNKIAWYENLGGGAFGPQQVISTDMNGTLSVHAADLDGDGDSDVLSASGYDDKIAWYENLGGGTFGPQQVLTTNANGALSVNASDLDGDGDLDVLSASVFDDKIAWFENLGGGSFSAEIIISTNADGAYDAYAADLDNDGDLDVLSASGFDDQIAWYENLGGGTFGPKQVITSAANLARSVYVADIDGDGLTDVLSASFQDDKIAWYENLGGGSFSSQKVISFAANGAISVFASDLDGDGDPDVLSASQYDDEIAWYENLGDGTFGPQQIIEGNANGAISVYAADLDGDGDSDVLSAANYDDEIAWYENTCIYTFDPGTIVDGEETICFGGTASMIGSVELASGGDGTAIYSWRSSLDNFTSPIPNATAPIYTPGSGLTQTATYRRYARDGTYSTTPTPADGEWTVIVLDEFHPGHIASSSSTQTICFGGTPAQIGSGAPASGGDGQITYTWRSSADNFTNPIPGANGLVYTPEPGLTQTTTFKRYAQDGTCNTNPEQATGSGTVIVLEEFDPGQIADDGETICPGGNPSEIPSLLPASGGDGQVAYTWRSSADGYTTAIPGANSATYTPAAGLSQTTTFRRYACDGTCSTTPDAAVGEWTVTVADTAFPTAVCQDITVQLDQSGLVSIDSGDIDGGSADNCGIVAITLSNSDFDCSDIGMNSVVLTVEDSGGNIDFCLGQVVVQDHIPPTALCQNVTVQLNGAGSGSLTPQEVDNGSSDACTLESLSLDVTTFSCDDIGANPVVLSVEDINGNVSTCQATATVADNVSPQALCQDVTVQLDSDGQATLAPATVDNGSADACGIDNLSLDVSGFDCSDIGGNTVVLTVEDPNGNSSTCTAAVTVVDAVAPEVLCQNATVQLNADGNGTLNAAAVDAGSNDACGLSNLQLSQVNFDCDDVGTVAVVLTATDVNGNSTGCVATVTVEDNVSPAVECGDGVLALEADGTAVLSLADVNGTYSDACGISNAVLNPSNFGCDDIGDNSVNLIVIDNNGNASTCTSTVTVVDTDAPVADCQDVTVQLDADGVGLLTGAEVGGGSTDACLDTLTLDETNFGCGNVGMTTTVTLTATDLVGNTSTCTANVTVEDNVPPVAVCQDATVQLDTLGVAVLLPSDVEAGSTDACGIGPFFLDQDLFDCDDLGTNPVTLTVEDENGNSSTCTATVTITDTVDPVAACQNVTVVLNADGLGTLTAAEVDAGSQDNCGVAALDLDVTDFSCDDIGPNPVVLTVTDQDGNESICSALVTVEDVDSPQALCQNVTVQLDASGNGTLNPNQVNSGSGDACGTLSFSLDQSVFDCSDVGPNTVTLTAEDEFGNSSTCTATVTVEDNVPPTAVCQPATLQLEISGTCALSAAAIDGGSSDACGVDVLGLSVSEFDCSDVGPNTVTLTVLDINGNSSSCTTTVTVEDNIDPTAICQDVTVPLSVNGVGQLLPAQVDNGSSDACGIASLSLSETSFGCGDVGAQPVTLTVTDANGNTNSCTAAITVVDVIVPEALCKDVTVQLDATGSGSVLASQINAGSSDACGVAGLDLDVNTFDCTDVGSTLITLTVTDTHGNTSTCKGTATVEDNIAPVALCEPVTVQLDASGFASLSVAQVDAGSSDACGTDLLALDKSTFGCDDVGANTVVLTAIDANGNSSSCSASVTVEDNIPPVALCQPVTVQLDGTGTAQLNPGQVDAGSADACGISTFTLSESTFDCDDVGVQTVTLALTDTNGNTSSCTAPVTVEDNVVPVALCKDATVQLDANGTATLSPSDIDGGSAGACGVASLVLSEHAFGCADIGLNPITLIVVDINGNASTCSATVTVEDNVAPQALCQDATVQLDPSGNGSLAAAPVDGGSADACGIDGLSIDNDSFTCQDVGHNAVTLTATDANGNSSTCSALITVEDNIAPQALCQDVTVQLDPDGNGSLAPAQVDAGSNDACAITGLALDSTAFDCTDVGTTTVTLTATDTYGNTGTCTATVTVEDNIPPTMVCNDFTVQLDAGGAYTVAVDEIDGGSADACGIAALTCEESTFDCADAGVNTMTLTGVDVNGNSSSCTATITVEDNTIPEALCQDVTLQLGADGTGSILPAQVDGGSNDACAIGNLALNLSGFDCSDIGPNTVALTVTDEKGNASSCTATVTVVDNVAPQALCQDVTVQLDDDGLGSLSAAQVDNGSDDACGIDQLSLDQTNFNCSDVGLSEVILTVTDVNGNSSTCSSNVTIEDNVPPSAFCQSITIQLNPSTGIALLSAAQINAGSTDACGIAAQGLNITSFDCSDTGPNLVVLTLTDVNGNTSSCNANVIVAENVEPVADCQDITVQLNAGGTATVSAAQVDDGSFDACGIDQLSLSPATFDCGDIGDNNVTLTVTDTNGNSGSCSSVVTVEDNVAPTALCQDVTIQLSGTGTGTLSAAQVNGGSSDACGIAGLSLNTTTFDCTDIGENTVFLTVTDVNGNDAFCNATVTVADNTPPIAICQDITLTLDASGQGSVTPSEISNGFIDACGFGSSSLDQTDFNCSDIGPNTVTLTQTDANGNSETCTATVTVIDNTPPQALCQNVTVQLNASGTAGLSPALVNAGSNDICGIDWISLNQTQFDCDDVGSNTVTLTVADINGNLSTCTAAVTVQDNTAPVAQCQDVIVEAVSEDAFGLVPAQFDNGSTDACGIGSFSLNVSTLSCADIGPNPVILTVMDANGNTSTCTAVAIVQDNNGPTAICPADITVDTDPGDCSAVVTYDEPTAVFVCEEAVSGDTLEYSGTIQTFIVPQGVTSVNIEAFGAQGGDANAGFGGRGAYTKGTFSVTPGQVLEVLVGEKPAGSNGGGGGTFVVDQSSGSPLIIAGGGGGGAGFCCGTIHDGAPGQATPFGSGGINASGGAGAGGSSGNGGAVGTAPQQSGAGGGFFSSGADGDCSSTGGRSYQSGGFGGQSGGIIEAYGGFGGGGGGYNCGVPFGPGGGGGGYSGGGASGSGLQFGAGGGGGSFNTGFAQNNVTGLNLGHGKVVLTWDASATVSINQTDGTGLSSGSTFPIGTTTLTYTATDYNGDTDACTFNVVVEDNEAPEIACLPDTVYLDASGTGSTTVGALNGGVSDNCPSGPEPGGVASITADQTTFDCSHVGINEVTLTAGDVYGNTGTCKASVTVLDTIPPEVTCEGLTLSLDEDGMATIELSDLLIEASDACGDPLPVDSLALSTSAFDCSDAGPNQVLVTATDPSGNTASCAATVVIVDDIPPLALCQDILVELDDDGAAEITPEQIDGGSTDACAGFPNLTFSVATDTIIFGCGDVGSQIVTLTVEDGSGNTSTCTSTVTVEDNFVPNMICQNVTAQLDTAGTAIVMWEQIDNGSSDACGIEFWSPEDSEFDCGDIGPNTVTLTATDYNGNSNTCTVTVTIEDTVAPELICEDLTVQLDSTGAAVLTPDQVAPVINEACGVSDLSLDVSSFDCGDIGPHSVTLTAEDVNGNTSQCTVIATVADTVAPAASCQDVVLLLDASGNASLSTAQVNAGSTDACGIAGLSLDKTAFDCEDIGLLPVVLSVTDNNSNTSTCTSSITVIDNVDPVAVCRDLTVQLNASGVASVEASDIDDGSADACGISSLNLNTTAFDCADAGSQVVTLTVEDANGNTSSCLSSVTVEDNVAPGLSCTGLTVQLDAAGQASITPGEIAESMSDACGIASMDLSISEFGCGQTGENAVTLTVEDESGNTSACTVPVMVEDNIAPVASCQDLTLQLDAGGAVILSPGQLDAGSGDACGISLSFGISFPSVIEFGCGDVGVQTVTLFVADDNGNSSNCTSTVTIEDNIAPVAVCQDITVQLSALGTASITGAQLDDGSADACGIESFSPSISTFDCTEVGGQVVTLTVEDENGNTSTCTSTVTVEDNTAPSLDCQDLTVQLNATGLAVITAEDIAGSPGDGCGVVSTDLDVSSFDCGDVGANTVTLTVTDDNSNTSTCTVTVTVEDNVAPVALCQDVTLQLDPGGAVLLAPGQLDAGSADACGVSLAFGDGLPSVIEFGCGDVGVQAVPVVVTDSNGNTSTCTSNVTIEDNVAPVALCQDVSVDLDASGNVSLLAADVNNGSNDACGIASLSLDLATYDCTDTGGQTVTLIVEDENGNISTCQSTLTVEDNTPPVASCQNISVELGPDGTATVGVDQVDNGTSDACGIAEIGLNIATFDCGDIGPNNVMLTAQDFSGNMSACMAVVTVEDNTAPQALCQNVTVELNSAGNGSLSAAQVNAGSNDPCGIAGLSLNATTFNCADAGLNSVVLTVTDVNGNAGTCTASVTVVDNVAPQALCQDVTVELNLAGSGSLSAAQVDAGSNDACGIAGLSLNTTAFNCGDVGLNSVVLTVTDVNGNSSTCTAQVTVVDNTTPTALCEDLTVQLNTSGTATITAGQVFDGDIDPCGLASLSLDVSEFDCSDVGVNTVTLTATDINGNSSTCTSSVTVGDNIAPQAVCQDVTVQLGASGTATLDAIEVDNGSGDVCGLSGLSLSNNDFDCSDVGTQSVTLTVTDNNGNSSSCSSTVTVEDDIAPVALCQDATLQLDASGEGLLTTADVDAGSSDNCGLATQSFNIASFDCSDVGEQTVILTVTDNSGNSSSCTATVAVEESVAPQALCQDVTLQLSPAGTAALTTAQVDAGSGDACGGVDLSLSATSFDCTDTGAQPVTLTVTDDSGNSSSCISTVTVEDNVAPQALCQDVTVQLNGSGTVSLSAGQVDAGSNDACGLSSLSLNTTIFDCGDVGTQIVTLTATDNNGNSSNCAAAVTVEDNAAPQALCQSVTLQLNASGVAGLSAAQVNNGSSDACGLSTLSLSQTSFDCSDVGAQVVTLTVTDNSGNSSTCTSTVTVVDNVAPQALCQNATIQLDAAGVTGLDPAQIDAGSNDACGIGSLSVSPSAFGCAAIGQQAVILTVTDNNGNANSCISTVTVEDNVGPSAICEDLTIQLDNAGDAALTPAQVDNNSTDACGIASLAIDNDIFSCSDVGDQSVTLTVEDVNGNSSTCTATVTVVDDVAPVAICNDITIQLGMAGTASITPSNINDGSMDACGIASFALDASSFDEDDIGDNSVTLTATDANGNSSSCTAIVTVEDNTSPRPGGGNNIQGGAVQPGITSGSYQAMVFPNPTVGAFSLRFERPLEDEAKAILRNDLGQEVGQVIIPAGTTEHRWANVYLSAGLYYLEVFHGDGSRELLKIVRKQY